MKRKIFSKLLMVALVIAAVSAFVSCKDYDDDINNLQKQIDAKAAIAQIESLQSQLTAAQTAAQKAQTDATKALADAAAAAKTAGDAATAKALEDAIAKVNAAAEEAAKKNADAIKAAADAAQKAGEDAAAAQTAADEAKAAAEKAATDAQAAIDAAIAGIKMPDLSGYAKTSDVLTEAQIKALISQNAQAKGEYLTASTLSAALADLGISASSGQVDLSGINAAIAAYKSAIDELYSIVTSVELIGTYTGQRSPGAIRLNNINYNIAFIHGKQATNESFGNNEDKFFQFAEADQITYKVGDDIRTNKNLLIRVNPTNATFTKEQIQFVDSKGRDLSEFIEITEVARYTGLVTRSTDNSGLWTVKIKVKDGADKGAFNTYVYNGGELNANNEIENGRQIVYAVAIKNDTTTTNRYVASTYDLVTGWTDYVPANQFNVIYSTASETSRLFWKKNRWGNMWNNDEGVAQDGIQGEDGVDRLFTNPELAWAIPAIPAAVPTDANTAEAGQELADEITGVNPYNDRRLWNDIIEVEVGEDITLSSINATNGLAQRYYWDINNIGAKSYDGVSNTTVEYYYVTLDLGNAIESRPSEYNAWKGYKIEGLNQMTHADDELVLNINDATAAGDYIGFRVYAVNYDGTLVDPDGRAFYVHLKGEQPKQNVVTVEFTANADGVAIAHVDMTTNTGSKAIENNFTSLVNFVDDENNTFNDVVYFEVDPTRPWSIENRNPMRVYGGGVAPAPSVAGNQIIGVHFNFLKADGTTTAANWKDIASVKVSVDNPGYIADGATLPLIYLFGETRNAVGNPVLNQMWLSVKKVLPTNAAVTPVWRASLEPDATGLLTVYPWPTDNTGALGAGGIKWTSAPAGVNRIGKDLTLYVNNKENFANWTVNKNAGVGNTAIILDNIAGNDLNGDGVDDNNPAPWIFISNSNKIGNTYDSHIEYVYQNISTYYDRANSVWRYAQDKTYNTWTSALTAGKIQYANAMDLFSYGLAQYTYADDASKKATALYIKWSEIFTIGTVINHFYGLSKTASAYATRVPAAGNVTLAQLLTNTTSDTNKRIATNAGIVADLDLAGAANTAEIALYPGCTTSAATRLANALFDPLLYPGGITATVTGDVTTLITVEYNVTGTDEISIKRYVNPATGAYGDVPTADKQGNIVVKGKDVFNKEHTIATIPFTLLYNK